MSGTALSPAGRRIAELLDGNSFVENRRSGDS